jgi:hypothetical protein
MSGMTDSMGVTLSESDPVLYRTDAEDVGELATVIKVLSPEMCLIQIDPPRDRSEFAQGELGYSAFKYSTLTRMKHGQGDDLQDAFEVPSGTLTFVGEMEWSDEGDDGE